MNLKSSTGIVKERKLFEENEMKIYNDFELLVYLVTFFLKNSKEELKWLIVFYFHSFITPTVLFKSRIFDLLEYCLAFFCRIIYPDLLKVDWWRFKLDSIKLCTYLCWEYRYRPNQKSIILLIPPKLWSNMHKSFLF